MIRNRETVPARALAGLADLDALDAAVVEAMNSPVEPHEDAVFLPDGEQLDSPLSRAFVDALPEGATFGFNGRAETGETWILVFGPGGSLGGKSPARCSTPPWSAWAAPDSAAKHAPAVPVFAGPLRRVQPSPYGPVTTVVDDPSGLSREYGRVGISRCCQLTDRRLGKKSQVRRVWAD